MRPGTYVREEAGWGSVERDGEGRIARLEFTVPGKPQTWQRARRGRHGPSFTPKDVENKMSEVRDSWRSLDVPPFAADVYLALAVQVFCIRPKNHYAAASKGGGLKGWALAKRPGSGSNGGDVDNFTKLVKDALNLVAYHDDTQIVEFLRPCGKWYVGDPDMDPAGGMPRTVVVIEPVSPVSLAEVDGQESLIASG